MACHYSGYSSMVVENFTGQDKQRSFQSFRKYAFIQKEGLYVVRRSYT
jgi:hypothetical protein